MILSDILVMPKPTGVDVIWFIFFLVFMGFTYFLINSLFRKQKNTDRSEVMSYAFLIGRGFSKEESSVLQKFISTIDEEDRVILLETKNWKSVRKQLNHFLINEKNIKPDIAVQIYDKLMLEKVPKEHFTVHSIQPGEICSMITEYGEELARIMKNSGEDLLLSSPKSLIPNEKHRLIGRIYIYRNNEGGFYIPGEIIGALDKAILFHITGDPQSAGHSHLMLNQKFQVEISNWPQIQEKNFPTEQKESIQKIVKNDSSEIHDDIEQLELEIKRRFNKINEIKPNLEGLKKEILAEKSKEKNAESEKDKNFNNVFVAIKLSDRGLVFEIKEGDDPNFWRRSELWKVRFQIPEGREVQTIGKILPSNSTKTKYLVKFVEITDAEREAIYEDIKKLGGSREVLN